MTADIEDRLLQPFRSLLDYDQFTVACSPYEGVVGQVLSAVQYADPTDVDWYQSMLDCKAGVAIDFMSGSGRLASLAAQAGWRVVAVDNSPDIVAVNRDELLGVNFVLANALTYQGGDPEETVDRIMCGGKSVSLLTPVERRRLFASARRHLRSGGTFVGDAYATFIDEADMTDVVPLNMSAGRLLWCGIRTFCASSTMVTNFLVEPVDPASALGYRLIATQQHFGIDFSELRQELGVVDLELEELDTIPVESDLPIRYHRFTARAI